MPETDFERLHALLGEVTLSENDFSEGDKVVRQVADFAGRARALDTVSEPWLAEWLNAEHFKAATLYAAGKVNWNHEQLGKATPADRRMRATIVQRFNRWVAEVQDRLSIYESSPSSSTVSPWLAELALFKSDPVRNP